MSTIDRSLVHRAAVSEVLVTDLVATGDETFAAGAQLPLGHAYFGDHLRDPVSYDFLLLLEAARQAGVAASHRQLSVSRETAFLVHNWSIELDDLDALTPGSRPGELELTGTVVPSAGRNGQLRGVGSSVALSIAGRPVGRTRIDVGAAKSADYGKLRFLQRRSVPPLTAELGVVPRPRAADTAGVGRRSPLNVVLGEPVRAGDTVSALVEPRFENASLFDHTYDHIPAMVITEGARQLAHLAGAATGAAVTRCAAEFTRFAELDSPMMATATFEPVAGAAHPTDYHVEFHQEDTVVARVSLSFAPVSSSVTSSVTAEAL
ncbi:AfsA-related hotdog domain-containing protein [Streptomyces goshikiensis]|uniref:AfsA-related hotdog domain-containing protein n=1 Tax=Streptomyces goshikiensis TaxID=1942 RepID=UPI003647D77C